MAENVSAVEENTLRVLLATMRKHDPAALERIVFDVLLAGLKEEDVLVMIRGDDDEVPTDDAVVEATVIVIRGKEQAAKFFKALEAAGLDEAEDTQIG